MKTTFLLLLGAFLLSRFPLPMAAEDDDIEGLWSYESFSTPNHETRPLVGLFWFHEGQFIHQAMHGSEPMEQQLTDAHIGEYQLPSPGVVQLDVRTGIVVTPAGETLLSSRSNTSHQVNFRRSGPNLFINFANGTTEKLVKVPTQTIQFVALDRGMLTLSDEHFVLVAETDGGWLAGSGRYQRRQEKLHLEPWRWFTVRGDKAYYSRTAIEAQFDGKVLQLPNTPSLRVVK